MAGCFAADRCQCDSKRCGDSGVRQRELTREAQWFPLSMPGGVHFATHRLRNEVALWEVCVGAVLAKRCDRANHEARVVINQSGRVEAEGGKLPRLEVLNHDVAHGDQPLAKGLSFFSLE